MAEESVNKPWDWIINRQLEIHHIFVNRFCTSHHLAFLFMVIQKMQLNHSFRNSQQRLKALWRNFLRICKQQIFFRNSYSFYSMEEDLWLNHYRPHHEGINYTNHVLRTTLVFASSGIYSKKERKANVQYYIVASFFCNCLSGSLLIQKFVFMYMQFYRFTSKLQVAESRFRTIGV